MVHDMRSKLTVPIQEDSLHASPAVVVRASVRCIPGTRRRPSRGAQFEDVIGQQIERVAGDHLPVLLVDQLEPPAIVRGVGASFDRTASRPIRRAARLAAASRDMSPLCHTRRIVTAAA